MIKILNNYFRNFNNFIQRLFPYRRALIALFHLGLFTLAYIAAFLLRFEGLIPEAFYASMLKSLPLIVIIQGFFFSYYDLYQGLWRYASFADAQNILRAILISLFILLIFDMFLASYWGNIPRSIFILDGLLVTGFVCGSRFLVRHFRQRVPTLAQSKEARSILIVGPMEDAEPLLREMISRPNEYLPMALIDPNAQWRGFRILDVPIVGGLRHLPETAERYQAQEILFAWPDAPRDQLNDIISECKRFQLRFKIVPPLGKILEGRFRLADVRDIEIEDLLPRPPVNIDREDIQRHIQGHVVLVTGAGGSIGSELCRQLASFHPSALVMLERAENSVYVVEMELRRRFPGHELHALIASINDAPGLEILFRQFRPHLVFHAAAYKHVPLMERCPIEAAYNNILGTRNLAKAALAAQVERFIMISTDKAVNPTSVMGVTKRIAEKYVQSLSAQNSTKFITTRFGNVLGSAGSVIPLFKEQLANGGPLTVTHPEIERFFMTIPEAVQLVLQAAVMGQGKDIFVLNMGHPLKIRELAKKLIMLAGKTPDDGIEIVYTGLRPGEKMFEELFNVDEQSQPSGHPLINRAVGNQEPLTNWESFLDEVEILVKKRAVSDLLAKFKTMVPNYHPLQPDLNARPTSNQNHHLNNIKEIGCAFNNLE
jgi:FlaA1/EpsC-like NDP-sugar epimerase